MNRLNPIKKHSREVITNKRLKFNQYYKSLGHLND